MKKLSTIIMALALVLGMSQCKKEQTPTTDNTTPTNPGVHITVNVGDQDGKDGKDNNGEKHNIAPEYGLFAFSNDDVLYVGHNGQYVGSLTFNNGFFSGTIYPDPNVTNKPLHFYFVGNAAVTGTPVENETTSLSISIADQHENLPVLSYGASTKPFTSTGTTYSATLKNKCALVKLSLSNPTTETVTLSDVPTVATVNFADSTNAIVATNLEDLHDITLRYDANWNENLRWVILLPGTNLSNCGVTWQGEGNMPAMENNTYVNANLQLNNPAPVPDAPDAQYAVKTSGGELTQFSVSANKKVYFSRANLKCDAANTSDLVWGFHENQTDECPSNGDNTTGNTTSGVNLDGGTVMDRFTWGLNDLTKVTETDWVDGSRNLSRADGNDWGCALIGTGYGDNWRTLTADEWEYLLKSRTGKRFLKVTWKQMGGFSNYGEYDLVTVNGIFIAPDDYNGGSASSLTWNNETTATFIKIAVVNALLADGCVFLPANGYRYNNYYYEYNYHYENGDWMTGNYWSTTGGTQQPGSTQVPQATAFRFEKWSIPYKSYPQRDRGMCVRLVWDAN